MRVARAARGARYVGVADAAMRRAVYVMSGKEVWRWRGAARHGRRYVTV